MFVSVFRGTPSPSCHSPGIMYVTVPSGTEQALTGSTTDFLCAQALRHPDSSSSSALAARFALVDRMLDGKAIGLFACSDKRIAQYLAELDKADRAETGEVIDRGAIKTALAQLEVRQRNNQSCQALMNTMGLEQFNTHESDARMMRTPKGPRVAYNVQTAVDAAHCLVLHHEVTQDGDNRKQLEPMAKAAKEHLEQDALSVTADAGYFQRPAVSGLRGGCNTVYVPPIARSTQAVRSSLSAKTLPTKPNTIVISAQWVSG